MARRKLARSRPADSSRRPTRPARPGRRPAPAACPCGRPAVHAECCGRFHRGDAVPGTPEELMRSRYAAFALGETAYLLRTWHPDTRPATLDLEGSPRWTGLEILATSGGSAFHDEGTVTFRAHYRGADGEPGVQEECSRFTRVDGVWMYVDGTVT
ncbi:YchJ family protein [Streptomyces sp. CA-250714]|uniref:YchJ family protein n=1 Tax=Streptomyces sp. CA-250714 TaxID=3240060 RepID=UPI003D8D1C73